MQLDPLKTSPGVGAPYQFTAKIINNTAQTLWLKSQWPTGNGGWDPPPPPYIVTGDSGRISRQGTWDVEEKVAYTFDERGVTYEMYVRLYIPAVGANSVERTVTPSGRYVVNMHGDKGGYRPSIELTLERQVPVSADGIVLLDWTRLPPGSYDVFPVNLYQLTVDNLSNDTIGRYTIQEGLNPGHVYTLRPEHRQLHKFEMRPPEGYSLWNTGTTQLRFNARFWQGETPPADAP